jgi:uncharacterized cupin superfamily protein
MAGPIIHWDDVRGHPVQRSGIDAVFFNLGAAAGTVQVGLRRQRIAAGRRALPPHVHLAEEELFFVLGGSGWSWQDGAASEARDGDCLLHLPGKAAHTLIAGDDGLDVLAFGDRVPAEAALLPRAKVAWLGPTWVATGEGEHPWARDAAAGEPQLPETPAERPPHIVNAGDVAATEIGRGGSRVVARDLGRATGSLRTGLVYVTIPAGMLGFPPHCHSEEEELFVVLDGEGVCLLQAAGKEGWEPEEHPLRRGSIVSLPAGTGVTHAFRAGPSGLTYLAYGTRRPNDLRWYPRSQKVWFKGLGVMGRVDRLHYWDGEA